MYQQFKVLEIRTNLQYPARIFKIVKYILLRFPRIAGTQNIVFFNFSNPILCRGNVDFSELKLGLFSRPISYMHTQNLVNIIMFIFDMTKYEKDNPNSLDLSSIPVDLEKCKNNNSKQVLTYRCYSTGTCITHPPLTCYPFNAIILGSLFSNMNTNYLPIKKHSVQPPNRFLPMISNIKESTPTSSDLKLPTVSLPSKYPPTLKQFYTLNRDTFYKNDKVISLNCNLLNILGTARDLSPWGINRQAVCENRVIVANITNILGISRVCLLFLNPGEFDYIHERVIILILATKRTFLRTKYEKTKQVLVIIWHWVFQVTFYCNFSAKRNQYHLYFKIFPRLWKGIFEPNFDQKGKKFTFKKEITREKLFTQF